MRRIEEKPLREKRLRDRLKREKELLKTDPESVSELKRKREQLREPLIKPTKESEKSRMTLNIKVPPSPRSRTLLSKQRWTISMIK